MIQFRIQPPRRGIAWAGMLCLCIITTAIGHTIALVQGFERFNASLWQNVLASILFCWRILPGGFLCLTFGYTEGCPLPLWAWMFPPVYCGIVLLLLGGFLWLRLWWLLLAAAVLVLAGAAGCARYAASIPFAGIVGPG